jgi:metal-responsive CopG/Arc/MetJ family transcriptional regulator
MKSQHKGRKRQKIGEKDSLARVNLSMKQSILDKLNGHAENKEVTRSLLVSEILEQIFSNKEDEEKYMERVAPKSERLMSEEDRDWIDRKIDEIKNNRRNTDLQEMHMKDLLEYTLRVDDWYAYKNLQDFIFDSFRKPYAEDIQTKVITLADRALWFSKKREDEKVWDMWHDKMFKRLKKIVRDRKWSMGLRSKMFKDIFGVRMLHGFDDKPLPEELIDFLISCVETFTPEERKEYSLAHYIDSAIGGIKENAVELKRRLLVLYEKEESNDDLKEYLLGLLQREIFVGV